MARECELEKSVLAAWHDDDDDIYNSGFLKNLCLPQILDLSRSSNICTGLTFSEIKAEI